MCRRWWFGRAPSIGVSEFRFDGMKVVNVPKVSRLQPLSALALAATFIMSAAILYNIFVGQTGRSHFAASDINGQGASTRIDVVAPLARQDTVVLKYDAAVEEVQRSLLKTGDYQGLVDGVQGKRTRLAIESYQQKAGLKVDGEVTPELIDHIHYTQQVAAAAEFTGSVGTAEEPAPASADLLLVQTGLAELGYAPGEITGSMTSATKTAILQFEKDRDLNENGEVTAELLAEISKMSGDTSLTKP
jgi:peptidoglycan hydrolase-like protein with peptidoglycan-binding domain